MDINTNKLLSEYFKNIIEKKDEIQSKIEEYYDIIYKQKRKIRFSDEVSAGKKNKMRKNEVLKIFKKI